MRVYVGNIPASTTDEELEEAFAPHGTVVSARVTRDRETGRSRGYGSVEYGNSDEGRAAVSAMNGQELGGRSLVVSEARDPVRRVESSIDATLQPFGVAGDKEVPVPPIEELPGGTRVTLPSAPDMREEYGDPAATEVIAGGGDIRAPMPSVKGEGGADVSTDAAISINPEPVVFEIKIPEVRVTLGEPDPDGVLNATTAALARHDPRTLIRQTEDVRRRMFQLSDNHPDSTVSAAATAAEASLTVVLSYLREDVPESKARPHFRSLAVLCAELAAVGIVFTAQPKLAALFTAASLIAQYCMQREK